MYSRNSDHWHNSVWTSYTCGTNLVSDTINMEVLDMDKKEEAFRLAREGLSFLNARRNMEAIDCFLQAMKLGLLGNDGLYNNLGIAYAREFLLGKAIRSFETALSLNPGNEQAHRNLDEARGNLQRLRSSHDRLRESNASRELQEQWIEFETPDGRAIKRTMSEIESDE